MFFPFNNSLYGLDLSLFVMDHTSLISSFERSVIERKSFIENKFACEFKNLTVDGQCAEKVN